MMGLAKLSVVLGGAASGKSAFAEGLVAGSGLSKVYVATSQVQDAEMQTKIDRHIAQRGAGWRTIEEPLDMRAALGSVSGGCAVLLDCVTLWLTNHLLADHVLADETTALLRALSDCPAPIVIVSNETGMGIVPENALARRFREAQGRLNIDLAARADLVVLVAAGLPLVLKGQLP